MTETNRIIKVQKKLSNGITYKGEWNSTLDRPCGKGKITFSNKDTYEGDVVGWNKQGNGTFTWKKTGNKYIGEFANDQPHGHGTHIWKNGDKYDGDFVNGEPHGKGEFFQKETGNRYNGNFKGNLPNLKLEGYGTCEYKDGSKYEGLFVNGKQHGHGVYTSQNGFIYDGNFEKGERFGEGKLTVLNKETKEPLYIQVYDKNGIMSSVEYLFKGRNPDKVVIDYRKINIALNMGLIKNPGDFKEYTGGVDLKTIKELAKYQMSARSVLDDDGNITDGKSIINGTRTGLENLIIYSEVGDDMEAIRNVSFEIEENRPDWPEKTYKNKESLFKSINLSVNNKNGIATKKIIALPATTTNRNHAVAIIAVPKIEDGKPITFSFYTYDSSGAIDKFSKEVGDVGSVQGNFCNHPQQNYDSCGLNATCAVIAAARHPEIFNKGIKLENGKLNDLQILQILTLQEVAYDLRVEKIKIKDNKRMIHHIVEEKIKDLIKKEAKKYINDSAFLLDNLGNNELGTYLSTLIVAEKRGLLNEHDTNIEKINEKLIEIGAENSEEVGQRLFDIFKEIRESKKVAIDEELLSKAGNELESLTDNTKIELLKKVNKRIAKELPNKAPSLQLSKKD